MLRIRFINTYEPVSQHYHDLIPFLLKQGYKIEVIASSAEYRKGREAAWMGLDLRVVKIPCFGLRPATFMSKLLIMLAYTMGASLYMLFGPQVDTNIFLTQPPLFSTFGYVLKRVRGQAYYQILMDLYPDIAVLEGALNSSSPFTRLLQVISRFALRHADGIWPIGRCQKEALTAFGIEPEKITVVPNWANTDQTKPLSHENNPYREEHSWNGKFVLMYAGNVGRLQYFDDILEVCRRLKERSDFVFVIIGGGRRLQEIRAFKETHGLANIELLPFEPPSKRSLFLSAADLHLVTLMAGVEGLAVPSKTYNILAAGRPVLYQGNTSGEIARLIQEERIGVVVPPHCPDQIEAAIMDYLMHPAKAELQGAQARRVVEESYSHKVIPPQIAKLLTQVREAK